MSACIYEYKSQLSIVLFPNQKPIRIDMTLPTPLVPSMKFMWAIHRRQFSLFLQYINHYLNFMNIQPTTSAEFQWPSELSGID